MGLTVSHAAFPALKNDTFINALLHKPTEYTPVWMMRQAGRYLPEYRATRANAGDFLALCKNADFACEVTLQPLRRYPLDAAILFSDILTVPDAMGLGLSFEAGEGPRLAKTIRSEADLAQLQPVQVESDLAYVMNAVRTIRHALGGQVPLIGFSGSPWTLATYMVEGGSSKDFRHIKTLMYSNPDVLHELLQRTTRIVTDYLNAQIRAGAQVVQLFDSWGGVLAAQQYLDFSLHYMQQIIQNLIKTVDGRTIPCILFTKGGGQWLRSMQHSGAHCLGLDWTTPLASARDVLGTSIAVQGNLDPHVLLGNVDQVKKHTTAMLQSAYSAGITTGYIANLGHGITQWTNPDVVPAFIDTVHNYRWPS